MTTQTDNTMGKITVWLLGIVQVGMFALVAFLVNSDAKIEKDIDDMKLYNHETYARRDDVKDMKDEILAAIKELKNEID